MAELLMPKFGLTMTEGMLLQWVVATGSEFSSGDVLFTVETEKVANDVEAEADGVLTEILVVAGETVPVGTPVAIVEGEGFSTETYDSQAIEPTDKEPVNVDLAPQPIETRVLHQSTRVIATPLARRIATAESVDLHKIKGSGHRGRIKAADVLSEASRDQTAVKSTAKVPAQVIEPDKTRIATAKRVQAAKQEIPHYYLTAEAEVTALNNVRKELNSDPSADRISVSHMLVKAIGLALRERPEANRVWNDEKILAFNSEDVGIVVETDKGLRVPVVRNTGNDTLEDVASHARDVVKRAKENTLTHSDIGECAISLSNVGMLGVTTLTPIINAPNAMIVGVGAAQSLFRPDEYGNPVARKELTLTLACDHRVIDGADAARFLSCLVSTLESPLRLLTTRR